MKRVCIKIKPSDTLFFRDGFTFKIGLNNYLQSLDIPYPSVFYGALVSAFLRQGKLESIKKLIIGKEISKINNELKNVFKIKDIYLYDEEENRLFVKAPLDIFYNDYEKKLGEYEGESFTSPKGSIDKFKRADDAFVSVRDLIDYYASNNISGIRLYNKDYFFASYMKTGISLNKATRTAKDKCMYRIDMTEFSNKKFSYLLNCEIEESELKNDVVKLGGESKLAAFAHTFNKIGILEQVNAFYQKQEIHNNRLKVILTSPMIIRGDYSQFKVNNNIIASVTGKPSYVGGYDMAANEQKKMERAMPSGSVLVIENSEFKNKKISEVSSQLLEASKDRFKGFGSTIIMPF